MPVSAASHAKHDERCITDQDRWNLIGSRQSSLHETPDLMETVASALSLCSYRRDIFSEFHGPCRCP